MRLTNILETERKLPESADKRDVKQIYYRYRTDAGNELCDYEHYSSSYARACDQLRDWFDHMGKGDDLIEIYPEGYPKIMKLPESSEPEGLPIADRFTRLYVFKNRELYRKALERKVRGAASMVFNCQPSLRGWQYHESGAEILASCDVSTPKKLGKLIIVMDDLYAIRGIRCIPEGEGGITNSTEIPIEFREGWDYPDMDEIDTEITICVEYMWTLARNR